MVFYEKGWHMTYDPCRLFSLRQIKTDSAAQNSILITNWFGSEQAFIIEQSASR